MPAISTKSVADKLMIKPGKTVLFLNAPSQYEKVLGKIPAGATILPSDAMAADIIQLFVASNAELKKQLPKTKKYLNPEGALWVTYYKGTSKTKTDINRDIIAEYAASIGFEGVAIISVDDDWSALRLKIVS
jgi:ABC-type Fe3+-hydroxamate transport system substrate-binding protein